MKRVKLLGWLVKISHKGDFLLRAGANECHFRRQDQSPALRAISGRATPHVGQFLCGRGISLDDAQDIAQESLYK